MSLLLQWFSWPLCHKTGDSPRQQLLHVQFPHRLCSFLNHGTQTVYPVLVNKCKLISPFHCQLLILTVDSVDFHLTNIVLCHHISVNQEHRGLLSVRYPMEHGIVKDWNDMERIWQYVYSKEQLQTFSEEVSSSLPVTWQ